MVSNGLLVPLLHETVWFDANRYNEAERQFYAARSKSGSGTSSVQQQVSGDTGISEVERTASDVYDRLKLLEKERSEVKKELATLSSKFNEICTKLVNLESVLQKANLLPATSQGDKKSVPIVQNGPAAKEDDDDDIDLFGSDEETEEAIKLKEARVKAYTDKKSKKPALVAKSSVVLDIKPWDDETDMKTMETAVRKIESDGLVWGASKLVPLAYGINKLQIVAVVEDEKVSIDWLQETIQEIEDLVQSVDIAAFNKL
ncbi:elongation factor 1-beta-like isoform X2 [Uloborus diversus]|uniref:elongation factor 1-beta-like isoform X2 n=1 Tax=Uloborus diversus TaxID=327109 RepID=UPI00240A0DBC|nr:elongation factor 1-beta-like isoform X2 [Uloborus diversus]